MYVVRFADTDINYIRANRVAQPGSRVMNFPWHDRTRCAVHRYWAPGIGSVDEISARTMKKILAVVEDTLLLSLPSETYAILNHHANRIVRYSFVAIFAQFHIVPSSAALVGGLHCR